MDNRLWPTNTEECVLIHPSKKRPEILFMLSIYHEVLVELRLYQ